MRKVFNGLLALSARKWSSLTPEQQAEVYDKRIVPKFSATVSELRVVLKISENDHGNDRIYDAIDLLYRLEFRFDVMGELDQAWTVSSRIVSQWARTKDGTGRLQWEYPPDVFQMLMRPRPFARIDMHLANAFNSGHTLALYENTCRYCSNPGQLTRKLPVEQWMHIIAGSTDSYKGEYRYFKRYVLNTALRELEATPACPLQITLLETKGLRGKVTHLQFKVELKKQFPLPTEMGRGADPRVTQAIRQLGVTEKKLNELLLSMEEEDLMMVLDDTLARVRKGKIQNPAGYFIWACNKALNLDQGPGPEDVVGTSAEAAGALPAPKEPAKESVKDFEQWRSQRIREEFHRLDADAQQVWLDRFKEHPAASSTVQEKLRENGLNSTLVEKVFFGWLLREEGGTLLPDEVDRTFSAFLESRARR